MSYTQYIRGIKRGIDIVTESDEQEDDNLLCETLDKESAFTSTVDQSPRDAVLFDVPSSCGIRVYTVSIDILDEHVFNVKLDKPCFH